MNILLNGVGGPTPRSIARSLKHYSTLEHVNIIGTDINPAAYGLYESDLYEKTYIIPRAGQAGYRKAIEKIIRDHQIDLAIVMPELEVEVWSKYATAGNLPVKTLLPQENLTYLLTDKSAMTEVIKDSGLVPQSLVIDPQKYSPGAAGEKLGYPFWIRAVSGSSGLGSLKVENENALKHWVTINPGVKKFIASTFLPGRNLACKMLYWKGRLVRAACAERVNYIMAKVAPSGITGNTSFGRLLNEPGLVAEAEHAMELLFQHADSPKHGFFTVDFKEDANGKPFITEVNVRHVAFSVCFAAAGANFAEDTVQLLTGEDQFDMDYRMYEFEKDTIFLRDVDAEPIIMKESDLLNSRFSGS